MLTFEKVLSFVVLLSATITTTVLAKEQDPSCPGSPAWKNAKCKMSIDFKEPCHIVQSEINLRLTSESFVDPHNGGKYSQISSQEGAVKGSRLTANGKWTDLLDFSFISTNEGSTCTVTACSESQVFSILDFSTNYCNLRNLYCNSSDGCSPVQYDLTYEESYVSCGQNKKQNCIVKVSSS